MSTTFDHLVTETRRHFFFARGSQAVGLAALASLINEPGSARAEQSADGPGLAGFPNLPVRAKRIIYLFQSGAPSQIDLFDHKPGLANLRGSDLPDSIRQGQRLTGMTSSQASFPIAPSKFRFAQHGKSGAWISELLPHTSKIADDLCFIKSMRSEEHTSELQSQ